MVAKKVMIPQFFFKIHFKLVQVPQRLYEQVTKKVRLGFLRPRHVSKHIFESPNFVFPSVCPLCTATPFKLGG